MKILIYNKFIKVNYKKAVAYTEKNPMQAFLSVLGILIFLIIAGNIFRHPKTTMQNTVQSKSVNVYTIGSVPKVGFQAQIEKSGVIQITAPMSAVVNRINVSDGQKVTKGTPLIALANNYYGGNTLSVARQLAEKQNQIIESTYTQQKDLIARQREIANLSKSNFEQLRDISNNAVSDTQSVISENNDIISNLNTNITNLAVDPVNNAALILGSKQLVSQFSSANIQLNSTLRNIQYQADANNPPSKLADEQRSLVIEQLDIADKSLDLNREISGLQVKLARINEATMYPGAPANGTVEQVFVRPGQAVNPGTSLLVFSADNVKNIKMVVYMPKNMADNVSQIEPSNFLIGTKTIQVLPTYISHEATSGNMYAVIYILPGENYQTVTDKSYVQAQIPVGYASTGVTIPFVPLDAVYQTQDTAYVFTISQGRAKSKQVVLGDVVGSYVRVDSGLAEGDIVIADRTVIDGDVVKPN